jgi:hypothetical protein
VVIITTIAPYSMAAAGRRATKLAVRVVAEVRNSPHPSSDASSKPATPIILRYSSSGTHPSTQLLHDEDSTESESADCQLGAAQSASASACAAAASSMTTSVSRKRPPGFVQWNAASKPRLLVDEEVENAIADDHVSGSGRDAGQRRRLVDGGADRSARRCPAAGGRRTSRRVAAVRSSIGCVKSIPKTVPLGPTSLDAMARS